MYNPKHDCIRGPVEEFDFEKLFSGVSFSYNELMLMLRQSKDWQEFTEKMAEHVIKLRHAMLENPPEPVDEATNVDWEKKYYEVQASHERLFLGVLDVVTDVLEKLDKKG